MATQREREDDLVSCNSSSDEEIRRGIFYIAIPLSLRKDDEEEPVVSTSDSDTTLIRSMSCLYHDRFRIEFGEETQQSDSDNNSEDEVILPKRSKTEEKRVKRVTSRESQFESYSGKFIDDN